MNAIAGGAIVCACTFTGALAGMKLRTVLSEAQLTQESKDTVKVAIGLIATISALVLGFVLSSAKNSFDNMDGEIKRGAAEVLALDRIFARYGPETSELRMELKRLLGEIIAISWSQNRAPETMPDPFEKRQETERFAEKIRTLVPKTENQRLLQSRAIEISESMLASRWMIVAYIDPPVHGLFFGVLLFWLTIIFKLRALHPSKCSGFNHISGLLTIRICCGFFDY